MGTSAIRFDAGDIAVVGATVLVDGTLQTPTSVFALVRRPDDVALNTADHPTKITATPGVALPAEIAAGLPDVGANTGLGLILIRFRLAIDNKSLTDAHGDWHLTVHPAGNGTDGAQEYTVHVPRPKAPFLWTLGTDI